MSDLVMDDMLVTRYDPPAAGNRKPETMPNRSGLDLDLCGDGIDRPAIVIPLPGGIELCPLKESGQCPDGCEVCVDFAEEMK